MATGAGRWSSPTVVGRSPVAPLAGAGAGARAQRLQGLDCFLFFVVRDLFAFYFLYGMAQVIQAIKQSLNSARLSSYKLPNTTNKTHLYEVGIATLSLYVLR